MTPYESRPGWSTGNKMRAGTDGLQETKCAPARMVYRKQNYCERFAEKTWSHKLRCLRGTRVTCTCQVGTYLLQSRQVFTPEGTVSVCCRNVKKSAVWRWLAASQCSHKAAKRVRRNYLKCENLKSCKL
jgi:hypothetical protein